LEFCAPRNPKEELLADRLRFTPEIRLACQTTSNGPVSLRRLVLDDEDIQLVGIDSSSTLPTSVGEEKELAVLFADIRGFTPFAEALPPYDVVHVLNRYFTQMGAVIDKHGGAIDNYMGDGFMALFGMKNDPHPALSAVSAALDMLEAMNRLTPYLEATYSRSFRIGIGIHFGDVVVGAIGGRSLKRVTAIGDAVNFASRIEAANKEAETQLLISSDTYDQVSDEVRIGKAVCVSIPGKSGDFLLYEVVGLGSLDLPTPYDKP